MPLKFAHLPLRSRLREADLLKEVRDLLVVTLTAVQRINFDVNVVINVNAAVDLAVFIEVAVVTVGIVAVAVAALLRRRRNHRHAARAKLCCQSRAPRGKRSAVCHGGDDGTACLTVVITWV